MNWRKIEKLYGSLIKKIIFLIPKTQERAANAKSKEDIFDIAERIERDSVMFTQEMIDLFPDLDPADFKVVLQEEKKHLAMVLDKRMDSQLKSLRL